MGYFDGVLRQKSLVDNPEEVIQTYANRLQHANFVSDRKSAVKGLKSFSKDHREMVVQHGLRALLAALEKDGDDAQAVKAILETLLVLFLRGETENEEQALGWISNQSRLQNGRYPSPLSVNVIEIDQFSIWIADEVLLCEGHTSSLLHVLREHQGFQIRLYALQLLEALVAARPVRAKESLLNIPLAIPTIVSMLGDANDPIRNETILLLMALVNNNYNIQKLVAFENTFERVFEIIEEEGGFRGSILVQDCLTLLTNLLLYNASNQKLFLETECIPKLARLIAEPLEEGADVMDKALEGLFASAIVWTDQRLLNMIAVLEICKSFVDLDNQHVRQNQVKLEAAGIFHSALRLTFSPVMENPIRRTALQVIGAIIVDNSDLQLKLLRLDVPYMNPSLPAQVQRYEMSIPAPLALLNWAILSNSVHVFEIRLAAAHALSCFFANNDDAKLAFLADQIKARSNPSYYQDLQRALLEVEQGDQQDNIEGLELPRNPATIDLTNDLAPLANLFSTLIDFNNDVKLNPYSTWFAASILASIIKDCTEARTLAREIKDGDAKNGEEVLTLIQSVAGILTANLDNADPRIAVGCLMLLSLWLFEDFEAVNDFLSDDSIIRSILVFLSRNSSESSEIVHGVATMFVGIVYEFTTAQSPISRASLFDLVIKALGADNYAANVKQFKENPIFKNFDGTIETGFERDATGLPKLYFTPDYIELIKEHFYIVKRALFRGPEFEPRVKLSHEALEELENRSADYVRQLRKLKEDADEKELKLQTLLEDTKREQASTADLLSKCQAELDASRVSEREITQELELLRQELEDTEVQRVRYATAAEQYTAKYNELLKSLTKNEDALKRATKALVELEEAKTKAESGINKMSRELFHLTKQKGDADAKVAMYEREIANLKKEHEKQFRELQEQSAELARTNAGLRANQSALSQATQPQVPNSDERNEKLRALQVQFNEKEEENNKLMEKLRTAASMVQELRGSGIESKRTIEALEKDLVKAHEDIDIFSALLDELTQLKPLDELIRLRTTLRDEVSSLQPEDEVEEEKCTKEVSEEKEEANLDKCEENEEEATEEKEEGIERQEVEDTEEEEKRLIKKTLLALTYVKHRFDTRENEIPRFFETGDGNEDLRLAYSRIARLEGNIEALSVSATESLTSFSNSRKFLQSRVEELESIKTRLLEEVETLKTSHNEQLAAQTKAFDELEGSYFDLELLMSNVEKNKEELDIKYSQMKKEYLFRIGQLQDEVQEQKKSLAFIVSDRNAISSEFALLEKLSNKLESELKAKEALFQALADKGADLAAKDAIVIEIKKRLAFTIAQLGEAAQKNRALEKEKCDFEKTINETKQKSTESMNTISDLEKQVQLQNAESIKAENEKKRLVTLQMEKIQTADILDKQRLEILALKQHISSLETNVKVSLQQLEHERRINAENCVKATLVHTEQVSKLEESITRTQRTHDTHLKESTKKYRVEIAELRRQLVEKNVDKNGENHLLDSISEENIALKASLVATKFELTESQKARQTTDELVNQNNDLRFEVSLLKRKIELLEKQEEEIKLNEKEKMEEQKREDQEKKKLQHELCRTKEQLVLAEMELKQLQLLLKQIEQMQKDSSAVQSEEIEKEKSRKEEYVRLQHQNISLLLQLDCLRKDHSVQSNTIASLQERLEAAVHEKSLQLQQLKREEATTEEAELETVELEAAIVAQKNVVTTEELARKDAEITRLQELLQKRTKQEFASVPAAKAPTPTPTPTPTETETELEEVLLVCEEQEKEILRLRKRLHALDLEISLSDEMVEVDLS